MQRMQDTSQSCGPDSLDRLCYANIVGLELVQTDGDTERRCPEKPLEEGFDGRDTVTREVIDDTSLEADVRMNNQSAAKDGVHNRVKRASSKRGDGQRNEGSGNDALKSPVIAAVARGGRGDGSGIVGGSLDDLR